MASSQQKPLKGGSLPRPACVAREVVHESRDADPESAPRCMKDGIVRQRPQQRARGAAHANAPEEPPDRARPGARDGLHTPAGHRSHEGPAEPRGDAQALHDLLQPSEGNALERLAL
eukprot:8693902-Alexandrium_andersonii.AAC.1